MTLSELLALFPDDKGARKKAGKGWNVRCPAHDDRRPSLHVEHGDNGGIVMRCYAGCTAEQITAAMGLSMRDLFADDIAEPIAPNFDRLTAVYDYVDLDGATRYSKLRFSSKQFQWRPHGVPRDQRIPYRWPDLVASTGRVYLVEGEKDADSLTALGAVATTFGGAQDWQDRFTAFFHQRDVVILPDNDPPGEQFAQRAQLALSRDLRVRSAQIVRLPVPAKGDVTDWIAAGGTLRELEGLVPDAAETSGPAWLDGDAIVSQIRALADEPWVSINVGMAEIARVRAGGTVTLAGPSGGGKSSLAASIVLQHARHQGWVLVLSAELTADEMGARMIGMQTDRAWEDVLRGRVSDAEMRAALPDRLRMICREGATLAQLDRELARMRDEGIDGPILVVIDYGQIIGADAEDQRRRVSATWADTDRIVRKHRAVALILSQMSRATSKAARAGERLGVEAMDGGAESAAIERYSTVVLEIGHAGKEDEHGRREVALSIGKGRMGGGDSVLSMLYEGRTGRWVVVSAPKPAALVREEHKAARERAQNEDTIERLVRVAAESHDPLTREDLRAAVRLARDNANEAIKEALKRRLLVELTRCAPRTKYPLIWTSTNATRAGEALRRPDLRIVE